MKNLLLAVAALSMVACARGPAGDDGNHGAQGIPGVTGPAGKDAIVETINPCGPSGGYDEIILRFASGSLIVYFEQNGNQFLTELVPGTYQTTDSQRCIFTVDADLNVTF